MNKLILIFLLVSLIIGNRSFAQDTIPNFALKNVGNNRILIGWHNNFESVRQISIQRSFDSLKNFKTILTVADPTLPENGYLDTKAQNGHMFYRLYIMLDKGVFLFSNTKRPFMDSIAAAVAIVADSAARKMTMIRADNPSLVQAIPNDGAVIGPVTLNNKPKTETWVASKYVYTLKDGVIRINLPDDSTKKYDIKFYTLREEFLFELKDIKERTFKVDKANFYHAGWFKFELYENEILKEKNRFYLAKEF
ncbi:MAG: hypothetical protein ABI480_08685 [Chitinophagaceae bacterium]